MNELLDHSIKVSAYLRFLHFISLLRLSHWTKAIFVLLGVIYAQQPEYWQLAFYASLAFCLLASAIYIYNDIQDRNEDSIHPHKSKRAIASECISISDAIFMLFFLLISGLVLSFMVSKELTFILMTYLIINLAYNHLLKLVPVLDVLCIAAGFMLRVLAGTLGIGLYISNWLLVAATLLSLFIALNKRQLEMSLGLKNTTRKVLGRYHPIVLKHLIRFTGFASFTTYLLYTMYARDESFYFILTIPFAAFALWRFARLSTEKRNNDDPVSVFLSDRLSRLNLLCFSLLTYIALY